MTRHGITVTLRAGANIVRCAHSRRFWYFTRKADANAFARAMRAVWRHRRDVDVTVCSEAFFTVRHGGKTLHMDAREVYRYLKAMEPERTRAIVHETVGAVREKIELAHGGIGAALRRRVGREVLKHAVGRQMFCPVCDRILDCKRAVEFTCHGREHCYCATCFDADPKLYQEAEYGILDGRFLFSARRA